MKIRRGQRSFCFATPLTNPNFHSASFLRSHVKSIFAFYDPRCLDPSGGFFQNFLDDGSIFDRDTRHLVSSARFVLNYSWAAQLFNRPDDKDRIIHGLRYLKERHLGDGPGYTWLLNKSENLDKTNHAYGLSFVAAAGSNAIIAGVADEGYDTLNKAWDLLNRFWESEYGAFADEACEKLEHFSPYRGQNANMHAVEALLWAFEATGEAQYLNRAKIIANTITGYLAGKAGGLVWEHFTEKWEVDWEYNKGDRYNLFRPWGFNSGHLLEWAKLLLILERHSPEPWQLERAERFSSMAYDVCWDHKYGGFLYSFSPEQKIFDDDKYYWVQAEALVAAKLLHLRTGKETYGEVYEKTWQYSWSHMIDHKYGAWFRLLSRENECRDNQKSPCGKTDYHSIGACFELIRTLEQ